MPDEDLDQTGDENEDGEENFVRMKRSDIRQLEKNAKKAADAEARLAELEKRALFLEAEVDLDSPVGQLLYDAYKGESTKDDIRAAAERVGALRGGEPPSAPEAGSGDDGSTDMRRDLAGGPPPGEYKPPDVDPRDAAWKRAQDALEAGASDETALSLMFDGIAKAAEKGDNRVIWDPGEARKTWVPPRT